MGPANKTRFFAECNHVTSFDSIVLIAEDDSKFIKPPHSSASQKPYTLPKNGKKKKERRKEIALKPGP
jgi:hypothetical protein